MSLKEIQLGLRELGYKNLVTEVGWKLLMVHQLMNVLQCLVDKGNSILVIEHNLDMIRCGDWVIDLGPEGGDKGCEIVVAGTP